MNNIKKILFSVAAIVAVIAVASPGREPPEPVPQPAKEAREPEVPRGSVKRWTDPISGEQAENACFNVDGVRNNGRGEDIMCVRYVGKKTDVIFNTPLLINWQYEMYSGNYVSQMEARHELSDGTVIRRSYMMGPAKGHMNAAMMENNDDMVRFVNLVRKSTRTVVRFDTFDGKHIMTFTSEGGNLFKEASR